MLSISARAALILALVPFIASAEDSLRAQMRADLMHDPRTAEMSAAELDALVEELAATAEADGSAQPYLESKNTFDPSSQFSPPAQPSAVAQVLFSPLVLAITLLGIVFVAVMYFIIRHGRASETIDIA